MACPVRPDDQGAVNPMRRAAALLFALPVLVLLAACRSGAVDKPTAEAGVTDGADPAADAAPRSKVPADTFVTLTLGDPESLDPAWTYESQGIHVDAQVYEGLVAFKREHPDEHVPALATEWTVSEDQLTYVFTLRQGVRFHEGGSLEPHDVAYSLQRALLQDRSGGPMWMLHKAFFGKSSMAELAAAELPAAEGGETPALGDLPAAAKEAACAKVLAAVTADDAAGTVTLRLASLSPWLLQLLSVGAGGSTLDREWMLEQGDWDGTCADWERWHDPAAEESPLYDRTNGTGPYKLASWKKTEALRLDANPDYWRKEPAWPGAPTGPAALRHVVIETVPEWGTRFTRLQAGEADAIAIPLPEIDQVAPLVHTEYLGGDESSPSEVVNPQGYLKLFRGYLVYTGFSSLFNQAINPDGDAAYLGSGALDGEGIPPDFFADAHVRLGFNHCFDWETYLKEVLRGDGVRLHGPIVKGLDGYREDSPTYPFDLERCGEELAKAWDGKLPETGFKLTTAYLEGAQEAQLFVEILADGLARVNPKYRLDAVKQEWPALLENTNQRRLPLPTVGWFEDYHDSSNWAYTYLHSHGAYGQLAGWPSGLAALLDGLVDKALAETDRDERRAVYEELQDLAMREVTGIYIYQATGRHYLRRELEGAYVNTLVPGGYHYMLSKTAP